MIEFEEMKRPVSNLLAGIALSALLTTNVVAGPGSEALNYFFDEVDSFKARFDQVVLDESLAEINNGQGMVWVQRPGLFRWNYAFPEAQEIVGDGENVWVYDVELEQVTVQSQDLVLGRSPALLLSGSGDIETTHVIEDMGTEGGLDWVNLVSKDEESEFREVRIGFEDSGLRLMELLDSLGQKTRIRFMELEENETIPMSVFNFVPPDGVDIIDNTE